MVILRGRGAQPIRPGAVIKGILLGEIPLPTGELVTEAAITDLHSTYKELTRRENTLRPKHKQLRGMTAFSFKTLFKFSQLLNLVELVREEPMLYPPPGGPLYSIRKTDGVHVVISTRRVFKLTDIGKEDERSWTNLCKAWREGWSAPARVEYAPTYVQPPRRPPKPAVEVSEAVPFKWVHRASDRQFKLLLVHLERLESIGVEVDAVVSEVDRLSMLIGDWVVDIEDKLEDAKSIEFIEAISNYTEMLGLVNVISEALGDRDLSRAIENLKELAEK